MTPIPGKAKDLGWFILNQAFRERQQKNKDGSHEDGKT